MFKLFVIYLCLYKELLVLERNQYSHPEMLQNFYSHVSIMNSYPQWNIIWNKRIPWKTPGFQIDAINVFVKKTSWPMASSVVSLDTRSNTTKTPYFENDNFHGKILLQICSFYELTDFWLQNFYLIYSDFRKFSFWVVQK